MSAVELLLGPILIGVFLNCILYGMLVVQTHVYFQRYKNDARHIKLLVLYLFVCETLNMVCDVGVIYEPLVIRYGTPRAITISPILLFTDPILTVMVSFPVQLFIAWRVKTMTKSRVVPAFISFLALVAFGGGIATAVLAFIKNEYSRFHEFHPIVVTWLAFSTAADVVITVSLVYGLSRRRTGFPVTDDVVNKIIRLTVQTGLLTSVSALLDIALFLAVKGASLNFISDFALSKLYSNSLLSTLNARGNWKATSTIRENILFEAETHEALTERSGTQIEIVGIDHQSGRPRRMVPMMVFDSAHRDGSTSAINVSQKVEVDCLEHV